MRQTWRWFGPVDKVTISDVRQAGAEGVVTALHHVGPGEEWTVAEIEKRQGEVATLPDGASSGLAWEVVESLPVSEAIKTQSGDWRGDLERYRTSLTHIAGAGVETVCYNFMPVLDWTRTDLAAPMSHGGRAMRFDLFDFAAFDLFVLQRPGAADDFAQDVRDEAGRRAAAMDDGQKAQLAQNIIAGLPGAAEHWTISTLREKLADYCKVDAERLLQNHIDFLSEVADHAERLNLRLCCHPTSSSALL